jgi:hypothetical protein
MGIVVIYFVVSCPPTIEGKNFVEVFEHIKEILFREARGVKRRSYDV